MGFRPFYLHNAADSLKLAITVIKRATDEHRHSWLIHFTVDTWSEFLNAGANIAGFREYQWSKLMKVSTGDTLLCYLVRVSQFTGLLEVVSQPFEDFKPIWKEDLFPARIRVKPNILLKPGAGVPIHTLRSKLSIFKEGGSSWIGRVRSPLIQWNLSDVATIRNALLQRAKEVDV